MHHTCDSGMVYCMCWACRNNLTSSVLVNHSLPKTPLSMFFHTSYNLVTESIGQAGNYNQF